MVQPTLTIDFKGLCAFVGDAKDPAQTSRLDVIMMAADTAVTHTKLCRHDPVLIFRRKEDFANAGPKTNHMSFADVEDQDLGVWDLRGKTIELQGAYRATVGALRLLPTYHEILNLDLLTRASAEVDPLWMNGNGHPGVAARLRIDQGEVSGGAVWSDRYGLAPRKGKPGPADWVQFRQVVRWHVYAQPEHQFLRLAVDEEEFLEVRHKAHLVISNLCPLSAGGSFLSEDILVYYELAKDKIPFDERFVFHPDDPQWTAGAGPGGVPAGPFTGFPSRPGVDACPPLSGFAANA
jgi:hypothetical protein